MDLKHVARMLRCLKGTKIEYFRVGYSEQLNEQIEVHFIYYFGEPRLKKVMFEVVGDDLHSSEFD